MADQGQSEMSMPSDIGLLREHAQHRHDTLPDPACRACQKFTLPRLHAIQADLAMEATRTYDLRPVPRGQAVRCDSEPTLRPDGRGS
jgi:hypothetical protein